MKTNVVNYTPIPAQVPRALAIEILHSHGEIITLNPLVLEYHPIKPPRDAPNDEYYSTWYEIIERIKFVPGLGNMGSSKVSFKGVFHDMPWGIQTHMYVPMGIELRHKWQVRGNQPGEPPEAREIGSKAPSSGLYLQENVEITSNPLAISFVKKELKAASKVMIDRMMKKAELIDSGALQAMFEDGKLKTINPNDRSSNSAFNTQMLTPSNRASTYSNQPQSPTTPDWKRTESMVSRGSRNSSHGAFSVPSTHPYAVPNPHGSGLAVEMLGDTHYPPEAPDRAPEIPARDPNRLSVQHSRTDLYRDSHTYSSGDNTRFSFISSSDGQVSDQSRRGSSYASPSVKNSHSAAELYTQYQHPQSHSQAQSTAQSQHIQPQLSSNPPMPYRHDSTHTPGLNDPASPQAWQQQRYNPQDYARFNGARYA